MRIRDVLMVIIAIGGMIFGWMQEGSVHIQRGFVVSISDSDALIHNFPKPIVVDLSGNGQPSMIACPRGDIIATYATHFARRNFENVFVGIQPTRQAQLYSNIVGFTAGKLTNGATVVAVVTDDYRLELFDSALKTLWTATIVKANDAGIILHHAAILVLPERIYEQDKGTVVIAVKAAGQNGTEHMLYAAYAGDTGEMRWRHVADEYHLVENSPADTTPAANSIEEQLLLTSPESLAERSNDLHWHHFREAVVAALPHSYTHPWDKSLEPHVFFHSKNRKKTEARNGQHGISEPKYKDRRIRLDLDDVGELGEKVGLARKKKKVDGMKGARRHPNVVMFHGKDSLEVLHLYTGKRVTRVSPLKPFTTYHDVDDDFHIDEVSTRFGAHSSMHHKHGVDITLDCLGVVSSGAPVAQDPIFNATICDTEGLLTGLNVITHFTHSTDAEELPQLDTLSLIGSRNIASETTRGVVPIVVQHHLPQGRDLYKIQRHAVFMIDNGLVTCVDATAKRVVWRTQTESSFPDLRQAAAEEVSMGLHSEEEKDNRLQKHPHLLRYSLHQHDALVHSSKQRYRETDPFVIAVGETHLTALNARSGEIVETVQLEQVPVGPALVTDFNGDGTNDIIVVTANSIYGFVVHQQTATSTIAMLMVLMIGVLVTLIVAREMSIQQDGEGGEELPTTVGHAIRTGPRKVKRSTD